MFIVDGTTITLTVGDTGAITIRASGYDFGEDDRALFTIKSASGSILVEEPHEMVDGAFTHYFHNDDTGDLSPGNYSWDVRYVIGPYWEGTRIVDGDQVITPMTPQTLTLIAAVGEI